jgi:cell wall-associated NlpC family hydrolase
MFATKRIRLAAVTSFLVCASVSGPAVASPGVAPADPAPRAGVQAVADPYLADEVPVAAGCIVLDSEWVGVKVFLVQRRLGQLASRERYDTATAEAVERFQARRGLPVTGRVDRDTWKALDLTRRFCIDRFTVQPRVGLDASRAERVEAMISFAREQLGRRYIWGGAGPIGYDCSGLVLQGVYAGGLVVPGITTYRHQQADYRTSVALYGSTLTHVPFEQRRRGDLVFWGETAVTHVAIYLGQGRILEAVRPEVRRTSLWVHGSLPIKPLVVRPFTVGQSG